MAQITANTGIFSGIPITDTVNQLVALKAVPRDRLVNRTKNITSEQTAITEIAALLLSVQFTARQLKQPSLYTQRQITSSQPTILTAVSTGTPALGTHTFTPIQAAQSHQLLSSGLASDTEPLGAGKLSFQFGGFVDEGKSLQLVNGGAGFDKGKIRITDRSGTAADIDLRYAETVDDVLDAINSNTEINVRAETVGGSFRLVDQTGGSGNLIVSELGGGTTAESLGLASINVAASTATGQSILELHSGVSLSSLNDGLGVSINNSLPDLELNFRDGSYLLVDLNPKDNSSLHASATSANADVNSKVVFTSTVSGDQRADVDIVFVNDDNINGGEETAAYDSNTKQLTITIREGQSTANDVVAALNGDPVARAFFRASLADGGDGTGLVAEADGVTTALPTVVPKNTTLGSVIDAINTAGAGRVTAAISADNKRIELTDLTTDQGNTFTVESAFDSGVAEALGLTNAAAGDTISGKRLISGLKDTLLGSFNGGQGLTLGQLDLTDRSGASASVDLSGAETLDEVIEAINAAPVAIEARINRARNGIELLDASGSTSGPLIVANGDGTNTATALNLETSANVNSVDSGSLQKQTVGKSTLLSSYNGGKGVAQGAFQIIGSSGATATINLSDGSVKTVGDLIKKINDTTIGVQAQINETGDGILLIDTVGGSKTLEVVEQGSTTAADLHILGSAKDVEVNGETKKAINGRTTFTIELDDDDTLDDLITKIKESGANVSASKLNSGGAVNPFHLTLSSNASGKRGELLIDTSQLGFNFNEAAAAQDAKLVFGSNNGTSSGLLASSSKNEFTGLVDGLKINVLGASESPVSITVGSTSSSLLTTVKVLVDNYNKARNKILESTKFNADTQEAAILQGSATVQRVENDLGNVLSGRFFGVGSIESLAEVGISINTDGTLVLDEQKLQAKATSDPAAVRTFFSDETNGFGAKFEKILESLAGDESLLANRTRALQAKIEDNEARINFLNERLEAYRQRTLNQFIKAEEAIGELQNSLQALASISVLPPLTSSN